MFRVFYAVVVAALFVVQGNAQVACTVTDSMTISDPTVSATGTTLYYDFSLDTHTDSLGSSAVVPIGSEFALAVPGFTGSSTTGVTGIGDCVGVTFTPAWSGGVGSEIVTFTTSAATIAVNDVCRITIAVDSNPSSAGAISYTMAYQTSESGQSALSAVAVDSKDFAAIVAASSIATITDELVLTENVVSTALDIYYTFQSDVDLAQSTDIQIELPSFSFSSEAVVVQSGCGTTTFTVADAYSAEAPASLTLTTAAEALTAGTECTVLITGATSAASATSSTDYFVSVAGLSKRENPVGIYADVLASAAITLTDSVVLSDSKTSGTPVVYYNFGSDTAVPIGSVIRLTFPNAYGGSVGVAVYDCDNGGDAPTFSVSESWTTTTAKAGYYIDITTASNIIMKDTECSISISGITNPASSVATASYIESQIMFFTSSAVSSTSIKSVIGTNTFANIGTVAWTVASDTLTLSSSTAGETGVKMTYVFTLTAASGDLSQTNTVMGLMMPGFSSGNVGGDITCDTGGSDTERAGSVSSAGDGANFMLYATLDQAKIDPDDVCTWTVYNLVNPCDGGTPSYYLFANDAAVDYITFHSPTTSATIASSSASSAKGITLAALTTAAAVFFLRVL